MWIRRAALSGVLIFYAAPALADTFEPRRSAPRAITSFELREQPVEIMAVTRRARADTDFHRDYIDDCESMGKVYPGYPQPALLSFDVRFQF